MSNARTNKADVIRYALESIGNVDINSTVMVGDRLHDVEGASELGIKTVGVTFGFGSRKELCDAGVVTTVKTPLCLSQYLLCPVR